LYRGYSAPEYRHGGQISRRADLYSLGVVIIAILTGQRWYQATEEVRAIYAILTKIKAQFLFSPRKMGFKIISVLVLCILSLHSFQFYIAHNIIYESTNIERPISLQKNPLPPGHPTTHNTTTI
jgi:serine/threonine protein kinase